MSIYLKNQYRYIILGAGLSGSLMALKLLENNERDFLIIDQNESLNLKTKTWSFFKNDINSDQLKFLSKMNLYVWPQYSVYFNETMKTYSSEYCTLHGEKFEKYFLSLIDEQHLLLGSETLVNEDLQVITVNQTNINYTYLIDARGEYTSENSSVGYQKFVGLEIKFNSPHQLNSPVLIDARVSQIEGFRFFYCLPFNKDTILVEDTRYDKTKSLDKELFKKEVLTYVQKNFSDRFTVSRLETGQLPLTFNNQNISRISQKTFPIGTRAGLSHPVTGYSLFLAIQSIDYLAKILIQDSEKADLLYKSYLDKKHKQLNFYRRLNFILFEVADSNEKFKLFKYCYSRPQWLIEKFYSANFSLTDKIIFFLGIPPVNVLKLLKIWYKSLHEKSA